MEEKFGRSKDLAAVAFGYRALQGRPATVHSGALNGPRLRLGVDRVAIELEKFGEGHGMRSWLLLSILFIPLRAPLRAQNADAAFFETKIRPVLATKCYACHSSSLKAPMGGLLLDTKAGLRKGGVAGPVIVAGTPDESRMPPSVSYTDPHFHQPPGGKLQEATLADFRQGIAACVRDPRTHRG